MIKYVASPFLNLVVFATILPLAVLAGEPQRLLHLSFENDQWVEFSSNGSELYSDYPNLVDGHKGKAASIIREGESGLIEADGNIDKKRGTISFWYKPEAEGYMDRNQVLFMSGTVGNSKKNRMLIWLWKLGDGRMRLRFDVDRKIYGAVDSSKWEAGKWLHIACSWDHLSGIKIYVNGELRGEKKAEWAVVKTKDIYIGQGGLRGVTRGSGAFDELSIYDRPLSDQQVEEAYHGKLEVDNATLVKAETKKTKVRKRIFRLSFEQGFAADAGSEKVSPLIQDDVELVDGFKGKAAIFSAKNSTLSYAADKHIFTDSGTLSFWMKTSWEPEGSGSPLPKSGKRYEDLPHRVFFSNSGNRGLRFSLSDFVEFTSAKSRMRVAVNRQVLKNTWHHYLFTWDAETRVMTFYLDGKDIGRSNQFAAFEQPFKQLIFGSQNKGIDGSLDEIAIYNYPFSRSDVMRNYSEEAGFSVDLLDYAMFTDQSNLLRLKFIRDSKTPFSKTYQMQVVDAAGKGLFSEEVPVSLDANKSIVKSFAFTPPQDGLYRVHLFRDGQQVRSFEIVAVNKSEFNPRRAVIEPGVTAKMKLIEAIDCSSELGRDKYRDDGKISVKKTAIGNYREAENGELSGFAYRIQPLKNPGKAHWLEITYPDDATRTFMVAMFQEKAGHVSATGLDTMGVISGGDHPITGKMQTKRMLFWPDSKNIMVACYGYHKYEGQSGPALATIKVYENEGLLPERNTGKHNATEPRRSIGLWQEDPSMTASNWFTQESLYDQVRLDGFWRNKWRRISDYLDYSGQNLWNLMLTGYNGDYGLNSNQIATTSRLSYSGRVPGWADLGALTLDSKGAVFYTSLNNRIAIHGSMGSLAKMIPRQYRRKYNDMREILVAENLLVDCIGANDYFTGSYNPLNPVVQEAYKKQVRLYAEKFGRYKNFGGVNFLAVEKSSLFFHNIEQGYGDYTIKLFEEETGVKVPVENSVRRRFSARYEWLMANAKDKWIQWRCQKIRAFYQDLAAVIREYAPEAKLVISLSIKEGFSPDWPLDENSMADYWRGCGVDFASFKNDSGIVLAQAITPHRGRIYGNAVPSDPIDGDAYRYSGFNPQVSRLVADHTERSAFISYHSNLELLPFQKPKIPDYWWAFGSWGGQVNGPVHAFANVVPSQKYVLEYMTNILANNDAKRIIHGWWGNPDNGSIEEFSRFYAAYRSIPAYDFIDVPGADDPVKVRYYNAEEKGYIYFVNQLPHPVECTLDLKDTKELLATLDGKTFVVKEGELKLTLKPYQVICLSASGELKPGAFNTHPQAPLVAQMQDDFSSLCAKVEGKDLSKEDQKILDAVVQKITTALEHGHYAAFSHLMQSASIRNIEAMELEVEIKKK